jgi:hypothetical protein
VNPPHALIVDSRDRDVGLYLPALAETVLSAVGSRIGAGVVCASLGNRRAERHRLSDAVGLNVPVLGRPRSGRLPFRSQGQPVSHARSKAQGAAAICEMLVERASELGSHLGPILIQLPRTWSWTCPRSRTRSTRFPPGLVVVEPRHASWFVEDVRVVLTDRAVALCIAARRGPITPLWHIADLYAAEPPAEILPARHSALAAELPRGAGRHSSGGLLGPIERVSRLIEILSMTRDRP